ncbi:MAG: Mu-like prophage major head subunit gpT family protein [Planctomycetes bacterium]|nr:Mu-like prophage major head subunit gpT family protein [Planctomycetota bacterium]
MTETLQTTKWPRINGVAYNGGAIALPNWQEPLVIDLAGLVIPDRLALLLNHQNTTNSRVGTIRAMSDGRTLAIAGDITATHAEARHVVEQGDWGLSIGAEPLSVERVKAGRTFSANGRDFTGPTVWVKKARLREVSIVAVGADAEAGATIAASWNIVSEKGKAMSITEAIENTPEALAEAERKRIEGIREMCGRRTKLAEEAIAAGWDLDTAGRKLLAEVNAEKPQGNQLAGGWRRPPHWEWLGGSRENLLAHLCIQAGCSELGVEAIGRQRFEALRLVGPARFVDIAKHCLDMERLGGHSHGTEEGIVRAAFSTAALPGILDTFIRRNLERAYAEAPSVWRTFCAVRSAPDFRENVSYRLSSMEPLERVASGGEIKHGTLADEPVVRYSVDTFAQVLTLDRRMIVNDDLSAFAEIARMMGIAAGRTLDDLVWKTILANPENHFSQANGNLTNGPDSALNEVSLAKAITQLMCQKDGKGRVIGMDAHVLVVPPELLWTAKRLLESELVNTVAGTLPDGVTNVPSKNVLRNSVSLACEPRISQLDHPSASASRWYLFAKPLHLPAVTVFLDGRQAPVIKTLGIDENLNYLAFSWRVFHDFGFALGDPRAAIMSAGK